MKSLKRLRNGVIVIACVIALSVGGYATYINKVATPDYEQKANKILVLNMQIYGIYAELYQAPDIGTTIETEISILDSISALKSMKPPASKFFWHRKFLSALVNCDGGLGLATSINNASSWRSWGNDCVNGLKPLY